MVTDFGKEIVLGMPVPCWIKRVWGIILTVIYQSVDVCLEGGQIFYGGRFSHLLPEGDVGKRAFLTLKAVETKSVMRFTGEKNQIGQKNRK